MKSGVNIICLYWVGDYRGRDYKPQDIVNLRATVDKWIDRPYKFYCLTNRPDADIPAIKIPFRNNWPGWWAKVELFRPDLPKGRTLYLDTDTYIVNNLQPILDYDGNLVMFDSREPKKRWSRAPVQGWVYRYQAATMLFNPGALSWVYFKFKNDPEAYMNTYRGEQDMYGIWIPNQPTFPQEWMLKLDAVKVHKKIRRDTIIVTGQPKGTEWRDPHKYAPWLIKKARGIEVCT